MIAVFGDSVAVGHIDDKGGWVSRLQGKFGQLYLDGKISATESVHNFSISGATSEFLIDRGTDELEDLQWGNPRIIVVNVGKNDSAYIFSTKNNQVSLENFKKRIEIFFDLSTMYKATKLAIINIANVIDEITYPVPWDTELGYKTEYVAKYNKAIELIAKKYSATLIDINSVLEPKDMVDGVHPNPSGHKKIFETVFDAVFPLLEIEPSK